MGEKLREPKGMMQITVRKLAEAAISVTHHDVEEDSPEFVHEVQSMERKFAQILKGKLKARATVKAQEQSHDR